MDITSFNKLGHFYSDVVDDIAIKISINSKVQKKCRFSR